MITGGDRILDRKSYAGLFFILCAVLTLSYLWVFADEFIGRRTYAHFQRAFKKYQVAAIEKELAQAVKESDGAALEKLRAQATQEEAAAKAKDDYRQLQAKLATATDNWEYARDQYKFRKSDQDAVFYRWKHALHEGHKHEADREEADYKSIEKELNEDLGPKRDGFEKEMADTEAAIAKLLEPAEKLRREAKEKEAKVTALREKLALVRSRLPRNIDQVVVDDLGIGGPYTFGSVDRCRTCHVATDLPGYETIDDALYAELFPASAAGEKADKTFGQVVEREHPVGYVNYRPIFQTHPRRQKLFETHPIETNGCTVCHGGDGRATRFTGYFASHENALVNNADKPHGLDHYWDLKLMRGPFLEASCHRCHSQQRWLQWGFKTDEETGREVADLAAPTYEKGKNLFVDKGCHGCHLVNGFGDTPKVAPELNRIASKVSAEWLVDWIENPTAFRADTRMPRFSFQPGMMDGARAAELGLDRRAVDPVVQRDVAVKMAAFLWQNSQPTAPMPFGRYPGGGSAAAGREIVETVGCLACHTINDPESGGRKGVLNASRLDDVGGKITSPDWIYNWIQSPTWHAKSTRMPDLRLTTAEAIDVTAFLWSGGRDQAKGLNETVQKAIADPENAKAGEKLMLTYGCAGCHSVDPLNAKQQRVGPELTKFADKFTYELAYGDSGIPEHGDEGTGFRSLPWARGKLKDPRQYIDERSESRMPNFHLNEDEVSALTVWLASMVDPRVPPEKQKRLSGRDATIARGQALVSEYNCIGCHMIEGHGGTILNVVSVDGVPDPALAPPNLKGEGLKISQQFLNDFLRNPTPIRRWLKIRMPTFNLSDQQISDIIAYFRALEKVENPYEKLDLAKASPESVARGAALFAMNRCTQCHIFDGKTPGGEIGPQWGPDLAQVPYRMRPEGVAAWLKAPQKMMPGTAMPGFFFSWDAETDALTPLYEDSEAQVQSIVDFLFSGPHARAATRNASALAGPH